MKNVPGKAVLCLLLVHLFSCQSFSQKREDQQLSNFTSIKVSYGIDVHLTQGSRESVEIEANEDVFDNLIAEVDGNTLVIRVDRDFWNWFSDIGQVTAYITFEDLEEIEVSGGSDLKGQGAMEFRRLKLEASGGSDIQLSLKAEEVEANSSGGSDISLVGYTTSFEGNASGGSDIKAQELETEIADISASGGSDAHVRVNRELRANASGGSDVFYYGNPAKVETDASGGSEVKKR